MEFTFITGNESKFKEIQAFLGDSINLKRESLDLPEIQGIDIEEIAKDKAMRAFNEIQSPVMVEDTGLYIKEWNGLPGILIKWFMKTVGNEGIIKMMKSSKSRKVTAVTVFCTYDGTTFNTYRGEMVGEIPTEPRGDGGFAWDPIFEVEGTGRTLAEMSMEEKNSHSMRIRALKQILESNE